VAVAPARAINGGQICRKAHPRSQSLLGDGHGGPHESCGMGVIVQLPRRVRKNKVIVNDRSELTAIAR
jgi:hypothetical protein